MNNKKKCLINAGEMANEYLKLLNELKQDTLVVRRGEKYCNEINELCEITKAKNGFND